MHHTKSKSKCVYIYSGNSTILVLDNRRWGAGSTGTSFQPIRFREAHSTWHSRGGKSALPFVRSHRMACAPWFMRSMSLLRPGSHQGHRAIRGPLNPAQGFKSRRYWSTQNWFVTKNNFPLSLLSWCICPGTCCTASINRKGTCKTNFMPSSAW